MSQCRVSGTVIEGIYNEPLHALYNNSQSAAPQPAHFAGLLPNGKLIHLPAKWRSALSFILTVALVGGWAACLPATGQSQAPAVDAGTAAAEIAAAKRLVAKIGAKTLSREYISLLTNKTAAQRGMTMLFALVLNASMEQGIDEMEAKSGGRSGETQAHSRLKKTFYKNLEALIRRYHLNPDLFVPGAITNEAQLVPEQLVPQGRQFLNEVLPLFDLHASLETTHPPTEKPSAKGRKNKTSEKPSEGSPNNPATKPGDFDYQVISPTRVKLLPKTESAKLFLAFQSGLDHVEARLEDKDWRWDEIRHEKSEQPDKKLSH